MNSSPSSSEKPSSSSSSSSALKLSGFPLKATTTRSSTDQLDEPPPKLIPCPLCNRKFHNFQALGGHQNAHRRQRQMAILTQLQFSMHPHQHQYNTQSMFHAHDDGAPQNQLVADHRAQEELVYANAGFGGEIAYATHSYEVEPPAGMRHHNNTLPTVVRVDDDDDGKIDLELRLATTSNKVSGK